MPSTLRRPRLRWPRLSWPVYSNCTFTGRIGVAGLAALTMPALSIPAQAIPSPELVVGSITSLSQLIALLSALLGGGAIAAGSRLRGHNGARSASASPWRGRLLAGLAALLVAAIGLDIHLLLDRQNERQARLEATLLRPSRAPHEAPADPDLKEVPYSRQVSHPLGLGTASAAAVIDQVARGEAPDTVLLDIRETAEIEGGAMPYSRAVRFPDLGTAGLALSGKRVVLFCHNGNRSAETCEALAAKGIDCRFMVGGMEKWLVEGRTLVGKDARSISSLRALPPYRNAGVLLDTAEVQRLLAHDNALLVDVRYPGEFERGHLTDAINLPIRPLPSDELKRRLDALPQRPVIAPCYDRRSCFFADILGLELSRAGRDFRGRYTTPWEQFVPPPPPPHVIEWLQRRDTSIWSVLAARLAELLTAGAAFVGLPLVLVALAAVSRLIVLPFSLKAERDQLMTERVKTEFAALRARLADDPPRLARATAAFYRRHGLTPLRNLAALLFLPVLAVAIEAAQLAATAAPERLAWLDTLAARDPTLVLPLLLAAIVCRYLDASFGRSLKSRLAIWLIGMAVFTATGALLSAAADIYIIASMALLLVQRFLANNGVHDAAAWLRRRTTALARDDGVVPLGRPELLADAGNKAYRLARIKRLGLTVPDGVVLTQRHLETWAAAMPDQRWRIADALWRRLGAKPLAVRSSAGAEDGTAASYAGVFESVVDVERDQLCDAIDRVLASFRSVRAAAYSATYKPGAGSANILLQRMFVAEISGVLFTRDPQAPGLMLIELVSGALDQLVSGRAAPRSLRYGRLTGAKVGPETAPIELGPLLALARRIETEFGAPQDIEWAWRAGRFVILQSRDITTFAADATATEWARLETIAAGVVSSAGKPKPVQPADPILVQTDMSELLPRPTPLSLALLEAMWAAGGSIDLAARQIGASYAVEEDAAPYHVTAFGRLYVDRAEEARRALRFPALARRRLERDARGLEARFRRGFLPGYGARVRMLEAVDFDRLPLRDLLATWTSTLHGFLTDTHVEVDVVNIAARCFLDSARQALGAAGLEPTTILAELPATQMSKQLGRALAAAPAQRQAAVIACVGHRAAIDYELADPRFAEDAAGLDAFLASVQHAAKGARHAGEPDDFPDPEPYQNDRKLCAAVRRSRRFQTLKEDAKHAALRELAVLRRILLAIDQRLGLDGDVFHCTTLDAVARLGITGQVTAVPASKRTRDQLLARPPLARTLAVRDLELGPLASAEPAALPGELRGTRVAGGGGVIEGRAHVVSAQNAEVGLPLHGFAAGDIIVSPMIHPAWLPQVMQATAVVAELGGWLSHMAIIAREHSIPMVVGVGGLAGIRDGTRLRLDGDGRIVDLGPDDEAAEDELEPRTRIELVAAQ